jgi:hypothetical protein
LVSIKLLNNMKQDNNSSVGNKRNMWEVQYDQLKLETENNKIIVGLVVSKLQEQNQQLKDSNRELMSAANNALVALEALNDYLNDNNTISPFALQTIEQLKTVLAKQTTITI